MGYRYKVVKRISDNNATVSKEPFPFLFPPYSLIDNRNQAHCYNSCIRTEKFRDNSKI